MGGEVLAHFFLQGLGKSAVVQRLAAFRVLLQQWHTNHRRLEVVGDEAADHVGTQDVMPHLRQRLVATVIGIGNHPAGAQAFGGHLGPHGVGCPQRLEVAAIDAGDIEDLVGSLTQDIQKLLGEDVSLGVFHQHAQHVALRTQHFLELQVVGNERVAGRNHPGEAGIRSQGQSRETQYQRGEQKDGQHCHAIAEQHPLGEAD
ncbi:hypothetical protein D9M68_327870 [compost metagenome]